MALKFNKNKKTKPTEDEEDTKKSKKASKPKEDEDDEEDSEEDDSETETDSDDDTDDEDSEESDKDTDDEDDEDDGKPPFDTDDEEDEDADGTADEDADDEDDAKPKKSSKKSSAKKSADDEDDAEPAKKPSFLKRGKAKAAAMQADEQRQKARDEKFGKLWRFYIKEDDIGKDFKLTFLDGNLDDEGFLETPAFREHFMKIAGRWESFVSCGDNEPDPLEEAGKEPYFAQAFTVIDWTPFKDKDGKTHKFKKRLYVVKRGTLKALQKIAAKRGGLTGCTFEVSRNGKKSPSVGDMFDFIDKKTIKQLKAEMLTLDKKADPKVIDEMVKPAVYEKELTYYTAKEIRKMGLVDHQQTISSKSANEDSKDVDEEL